ncbi:MULTISPECIES: hypothetical protein [unclassified Mesorhizobium]|uniref:hypothetical protein n=1 Tax=unclassified Mesorhizobium TaxID=325217 RepID=UPI0030144AB7
MVDGVDRMTRAGNYVLGLMDDDERERAERDLERDGDFRDAVVEVAERMHLFDIRKPPQTLSQTMWEAISERIAELPQMHATSSGDGKADTPTRPIIQPEGTKAIWRGPHSVGGSRGLLMAAALIAAFALGYLTASL